MDDSQVQTTNRAETPKKKEIYNVILHNYEIKYIMQWVMYALNTDNRWQLKIKIAKYVTYKCE